MSRPVAAGGRSIEPPATSDPPASATVDARGCGTRIVHKFCGKLCGQLAARRRFSCPSSGLRQIGEIFTSYEILFHFNELNKIPSAITRFSLRIRVVTPLQCAMCISRGHPGSLPDQTVSLRSSPGRKTPPFFTAAPGPRRTRCASGPAHPARPFTARRAACRNLSGTARGVRGHGPGWLQPWPALATVRTSAARDREPGLNALPGPRDAP